MGEGLSYERSAALVDALDPAQRPVRLDSHVERLTNMFPATFGEDLAGIGPDELLTKYSVYRKTESPVLERSYEVYEYWGRFAAEALGIDLSKDSVSIKDLDIIQTAAFLLHIGETHTFQETIENGGNILQEQMRHIRNLRMTEIARLKNDEGATKAEANKATDEMRLKALQAQKTYKSYSQETSKGVMSADLEVAVDLYVQEKYQNDFWEGDPIQKFTTLFGYLDRNTPVNDQSKETEEDYQKKLRAHENVKAFMQRGYGVLMDRLVERLGNTDKEGNFHIDMNYKDGTDIIRDFSRPQPLNIAISRAFGRKIAGRESVTDKIGRVYEAYIDQQFTKSFAPVPEGESDEISDPKMHKFLYDASICAAYQKDMHTYMETFSYLSKSLVRYLSHPERLDQFNRERSILVEEANKANTALEATVREKYSEVTEEWQIAEFVESLDLSQVWIGSQAEQILYGLFNGGLVFSNIAGMHHTSNTGRVFSHYTLIEESTIHEIQETDLQRGLKRSIALRIAEESPNRLNLNGLTANLISRRVLEQIEQDMHADGVVRDESKVLDVAERVIGLAELIQLDLSEVQLEDEVWALTERVFFRNTKMVPSVGSLIFDLSENPHLSNVGLGKLSVQSVIDSRTGQRAYQVGLYPQTEDDRQPETMVFSITRDKQLLSASFEQNPYPAWAINKVLYYVLTHIDFATCNREAQEDTKTLQTQLKDVRSVEAHREDRDGMRVRIDHLMMLPASHHPNQTQLNLFLESYGVPLEVVEMELYASGAIRAEDWGRRFTYRTYGVEGEQFRELGGRHVKSLR